MGDVARDEQNALIGWVMIGYVERFLGQWVADHGVLVRHLADVRLPGFDVVMVVGVYLAGIGWLIRVVAFPLNHRDLAQEGVRRLVPGIVRLAMTIVLVMLGLLLAAGRAAGRSHYRW